jgi:hypothetical protein
MVTSAGGLHTKSNFLATLGRERHRPQGEPSSGNKTALDWLKNSSSGARNNFL